MNQEFPYQTMSEESRDLPGVDTVPTAPVSRAHKGLSIASLVLGILSVCSCCCCCGAFFFPLIFGIVSVVLAILARVKSPDKKMGGMAIAGLILGVVGILLAIFLLLVTLVLLSPDSEFWVEYEMLMREELGDEAFEEIFGDDFPNSFFEIE